MDIGCNLGVTTIILAKQNPNSIIYAYEPCKEIYDIMLENILINKCTNVKPFNCAVSGNDEKKICVCPRMTGANSTHADIEIFKKTYTENYPYFLENKIEKYDYDNIYSYDVECISLDKIIEDNNISKIDLMKIDCEGAEYDILYNSEYLKKNICINIVGEFHNLKYCGKNDAEELKKYCHKYISGDITIGILSVTD